MLPTFPNFTEISPNLRDEMYSFTNKYEPYSDFNFTSLYTYDVDRVNKIALLNDNLVIALSDYHTGKPFFSFLGNNKPDETAETLLKFSIDNGYGDTLKMVPEVSSVGITKFNVAEDRDNFDYIYDVEELAALKGNKFDKQRNLIKRFMKANPDVNVKKLSFDTDKDKQEIMELFDLWTQLRSKTIEETTTEKTAVSRVFNVESDSFVCIGIFDQQKLIGFSIDEILANGYAIGHFGKYNNNYLGINQFMYHLDVEILKEKGAKYLNLEQDLGDKGLRLTKTLLRPVKFLKKYIIS